jgi:hypothetical protein
MNQRPRGTPWLWAGIAACLLSASGAAAQVSTSAVVRGEVRDSAGLAVPQARVEVRDSAGRVLGGTATDGQGRYILLGLPPGGPYTLAAEHRDLAVAVQDGLYLTAGESRRVLLVVAMRPVELPGIRVTTAPDPTFSGTRTGAATVVEERTIRTLPTIDRDIVGFAALSPMVSIHEGAISVAGQNSRFNSLRIDGAVSQDIFGLSPSGVPGGHAGAKPLPIDAIREYSVLVAPYDVRQGGFTGGLLNATTRSGGDRWDGTAFAYYRDAAFSGDVHESELLRHASRGVTPDFRTQAGGFAVGGPVGGARVFAAGEVERRFRPLPGIHLERTEPLVLGLQPDSVARMIDVLERVYGMDPGDAGTYALENPLGNLFFRLDVPVAPGHDLTTHYNWISARDDIPASRLGFGPYQLTSAGARLESESHSAVTRLGSRLGEHTTNELLLSIQRTSDATVARSDMPQIEVLVSAHLGSQIIRRYVQAGGDPLAHDNTLRQTAIRLANNLSHARGRHLFTAGVEAGWSGIRRTHLPASRGIWRFLSVAELEANVPWTFERLVLDPAADPAVEFGLLQLAGYLHDEWAVGDALSLAIGVRMDMPLTLSRPGYNRAVEMGTGIVTDHLPAGNVLFSPRIGFNYSPDTRRRLQIRGGAGLFAAPPPLAWIADVHANTGLRSTFLVCNDGYTALVERIRETPVLGGWESPTACLNGGGHAGPGITFFADDFRYPQDVRASIGVDRELPLGIVATVDALYTRALHQVSMEDINLGPESPGPIDMRSGYAEGIGNRPVFGVPRLLPDRFGALDPQRRWPEYGQVIRIGNRSRNAALSVATELQRRFTDRLDFRVAYTYTRAVDTRSLLYQDAALNYGLTPIRSDPARPETRLSAFDRPHRVMGTAWARIAPWGEGLDAALIYLGQSGLPYSYVYDSDVNGDGFPGPGAAGEAYNDLLYVPVNSAEVPADVMSMSMLFQLAAKEPCLEQSAGAIMARNACRAPWSNRLDLRLSQGLRLPAGRVRITADVLNVLNLLNGDWGLVQVAPPVVPVFRFDYRIGCPGPQCMMSNPLIGSYTGPRKRDPETGLMTADRPYVISYPDSHWRAQLGIRIDF